MGAQRFGRVAQRVTQDDLPGSDGRVLGRARPEIEVGADDRGAVRFELSDPGEQSTELDAGRGKVSQGKTSASVAVGSTVGCDAQAFDVNLLRRAHIRLTALTPRRGQPDRLFPSA